MKEKENVRDEEELVELLEDSAGEMSPLASGLFPTGCLLR